MTLEEYLKKREEEGVEVGVSEGGEYPHQERWEYGKEELEHYRKIWTAEYYREEEERNAGRKGEKIEKAKRSRRRRKGQPEPGPRS